MSAPSTAVSETPGQLVADEFDQETAVNRETAEIDEALKAKEAQEILSLEGADNPQNWSHAKKVGKCKVTSLGKNSSAERSR